MSSAIWHIQPPVQVPHWFLQAVQRYTPDAPGTFVASLLWQRGIRDLDQLAEFINPDVYRPASPFDFDPDMAWAVARLQQAREGQEDVVIWGDFDADGLTATAVLWEGLGQFLSPEHLSYFIPNRLQESHGLSAMGLQAIAQEGCQLVITCDTGSGNWDELVLAQELGLDVIVTDHHTLPPKRPPVVAFINPRTLYPDHPLACLSGVAVAYKLVEALYQSLPTVPHQPLETLLDLVAIGLVADLVNLRGDCRYLAQQGIRQLKRCAEEGRRPGIVQLLQFCKRSGDRPTDIAFGLGPRINAVSRIQGDASFCVELLTSQDQQRCQVLAEDTELANTRRRALQQQILHQARSKLATLDLSTLSVLVLMEPGWPVGILGLVAGQLAQEYSRPAILLSTPIDPDPAMIPLARGSARSVNNIDLYELIQDLGHLLHRFGGHPLAAGISLPVENLPLFAETINHKLRQQQVNPFPTAPPPRADLKVTVADLGLPLFRGLKLLEPCGMGNPTPQLWLQNCWFQRTWQRNIRDKQGKALQYIRTRFELWDDSATKGFPGIWWGHYKDEIPLGRCDVIAELDFNPYEQHCELRLVAVRPHTTTSALATPGPMDWLLDWRQHPPSPGKTVPQLTQCPWSWEDLRQDLHRVHQTHSQVAIAFRHPSTDPGQTWQQLLGLAKYLGRTHQTVSRQQLQDRLMVGDRSLNLGLTALSDLGFELVATATTVEITALPKIPRALSPRAFQLIQEFLTLVQETRFRQEYFVTVPLTTIQIMTA